VKKKLTFGHLFLLNQVVLALVVLSVIGVYGTYLVHVEQRAIRDRIEPILNREVDRMNSDIQSLEGNVQKLKSLVELFDVIPQSERAARFVNFASTTIAPHSTQFNAFFALGPRLSQKYFNRPAFIQVVHRDYSLFASALYNDPATFVGEKFPKPGYDTDPDMEWWAMNNERPGINYSPFYFDKDYMEKVMFTAATGLYREGKLEAVIGVDTLASDIAHRLGLVRLGETGGVLLVDELGRPVLPFLAKDQPLIGYRYLRAFTRDEFRLLPTFSEKKFNVDGLRIQDFLGSDGKKYVTYSKALKDRPMHAVVYQEKSEAFAGLYYRLFFFILVALVLYVLVTMMIWVTGKYVMDHDRQAMTELRDSHDKAQAATKAKSLFLSTMSHEIRTPLNSLLGSTELMAETDLSREQESYLRSLQEAGDVLLSVVNNILDFSKIESGKMQLESREFMLSDLIEELESFMRAPVHRRGLRWVLHAPLEDRKLQADPFRIKQVLLNLLSNATKFTEKGAVELSVQLLNSSNLGFERVYFEVKDTGVGIAKENILRIFEEFKQEDSSVTRKFGGTGLGLSICRRIVQLMNSELLVESQQYAGSKFFFVLDLPSAVAGPWPFKKPMAMPEPPKALVPEVKLEAHRVLVVDDMEENHALIKAYLKRTTGIAVESAYSGMECLEKCEKHRYAMVLMDVQMPRMSGLETIRRLRGWETARGMERVPIVVISANSFTEDVEKSLEAGADGHCGKPVRKQTILELVGRYCQSRETSFREEA
jgi:signal transduction histidine kinase/ActR/RegA family two-component response regulator